MVLGEKREIGKVFVKNQGERILAGIQLKEYIII